MARIVGWTLLLLAEFCLSMVEATSTTKPTTAATSAICRYASADRCTVLAVYVRPTQPIHTFRGDARSNLNIWFFKNHAALERPTACPAMLCCQGPLAVSVGESRDGNHTDAAVVVAAVSWTETNSPSCLPASASHIVWSGITYLSRL